MWYNGGMIKFIITAIALLGVAIPIIATDFWLLWLPIDHSEQYPSKMAALFMAVTAWVTLWVVLAVFRTIKQRDDQEKRDRRERLLNEIIEWAINVGTYMLSRNLPPFEKHYAKDGTYYGEYLDESTQDIVISEYTKFRMQSVYVAEISKAIPTIECLVKDAIKHLRQILRLLNKYNERCDDIYVKNGEEKAARNIARNEDRLYNRVVEIIQTIGNIGTLD